MAAKTKTEAGTPAKRGRKPGVKAAVKAAAVMAGSSTFERMQAAIRDYVNEVHQGRVAAGQLTDVSTVNEIISVIDALKDSLSDFIVVVTPAQRKKYVSGAGLKNHGFVEVVSESAAFNPQFMPPGLKPATFGDDMKDFENKLQVYSQLKQLTGDLWDTLLASSDAVFRDALAYYNFVHELARQNVRGAEAEYMRLKPRFKQSRRSAAGEPTDAQIERDVHALLKGRKAGEVVVRNVRPTVEGGGREVSDRVDTGSEELKETVEKRK